MLKRLFLLRSLRRWHARIGFVAMAFFLVLALTGLALNHGREFRIDGQYVHYPWLARWYGIEADVPRQAFRSRHHEVIAANGRWLLDGRSTGEKFPQPVGLVELPDMFVIASGAALYLYRDDGALIDRLDPGALPGMPIRALGTSAGTLMLRTDAGNFSSVDALAWQSASPQNTEWSMSAPISAAEQQRYEEALTPGVSVQQLLLDLHSGRITGRFGPLLVDLLAVLLAVLSLTGAWLFLVPRRRRERH